MLLKGEVLGSRLTNNLIMELMRTHNRGVGVGVLQRCEPGAHGAGSSHGAGCHRTVLHFPIYRIAGVDDSTFLYFASSIFSI